MNAKFFSLPLFSCTALTVSAFYLGEPKQTVAEVQYPERVFTNASGRVCVDFGKDAFGWLEIDAPAAGLDYFLALGESLLENGTLDRTCSRCVRCLGVKWHTEMAGFQRLPVPPDLRNLFTSKEGAAIRIPEKFGLITPFRAVEIYESGFPVTAKTIRRHVVTYPADRTESAFSCDDERLNKVWDFCKYSMFATSFAGQFVDGDRERIPYEADAFVSQLNWYAISSDYAYPRKSIEYLYNHPTWPTEFKQASILSAWADWIWTGDTGSIERNYDLLKSEKLLLRWRRADGLLRTGGERRPHPHLTNELGLADIVDWPKTERDGFEFREVNAVVNAFHYRNLLAMADIAEAIGRKSDAETFKKQARETYDAFQRTFFDAERGLYLDGEGASHASIHANALALAFGLVPQGRIGKVADWVESRGMACSVYFSQYLLAALFKTGRDAAALRLLMADDDRSWIGMMKRGATITMEAWNVEVKPNLDWNHAWGAVPLNIVSRYLLGVTPIAPGFKKIAIRPRLGGLKRVSAVVPTAAGRVVLNVTPSELEFTSPSPAEVTFAGETRRFPAGRHRVGTSVVKTVKASSFGWNAEDSTVFLQRALDSGASKVVVDRQAGDWITRPLFITNSNVEVVLEDGVTIRAKRGAFRARNDCLVRIMGGAKNVTLRGEGKATLAMNKQDYLDPEQKYEFSEWRHTVSILNAENVTVKDLTLLSSGGDGVYPNRPKNVTLENLKVYDHLRQGISPISVEGMVVRRCEFNDTVGAPPQCGADLEPNRETDRFIDVLFEDCRFNGNASHGIDLYFGHLTGKSAPVSITFRRCVAKGNSNCGVSMMLGKPGAILKSGQVGGSIRFEDCRFEGNGQNALRLANYTENGPDISFAHCRFDARGSRSDAAISLYNGLLPKDFGGIRFEDCEVLLDRGRAPFEFMGMTGVGIAGKLVGTVGVNDGAGRRPFDLAAFASKHVPRPELVMHFKAAEVEYEKIAAPVATKLKGIGTPQMRKLMFTYVQAVPAAGEYAIRFKARRLRKNVADSKCAVVQLLDRAGTDLGSFDLPEGEFTYRLKAHNANIYRFEVSPKSSALVSVTSDTPGGALEAGRPVHIFGGRKVDFYFRVPANAKEVLVNLMPEEPGSAQLFDATGKLVDEMPFLTEGKVIKGVRTPSAADEIWRLHFPKIQEDFSFQVGGDAIPLLSMEPEGVVAGAVGK